MHNEPDFRVKRWSGGVLFLAVVGAIALITALAFIVFAVSVAKLFSSSGGMKDLRPQYLDTLHFSSGLAEIRLNQPIDSEIAGTVVEKLQQAADDERIKGIILEVDSPGGTVVASQEIYDSISKIKTKTPVVAFMRDVAASGAYYSSVPSSWIIANRGTMVGSIGVIMENFEASKLIQWMKLQPVTLKTGKLKDAGSSVRPWTGEDRAYLQQLINDTRDQFVADVRRARPQLSPETMRYMSDGRVILGTEALNRKLIDALGNRTNAIEKAAELAGLSSGADTEVFTMEKHEIRGLFGEILGVMMQSAVRLLASELTVGRQSNVPEQLPRPRL
ncbi:MAG: signal peptide peptidase SppA [Proteobacteria bacterium]|nr:signal peptide peptidase SppA [Pseudomonadota bacterium]